MNRIGISLTAIGLPATVAICWASLYTEDYAILMSLIITVPMAIAGIVSLIKGDDGHIDRTMILALSIVPSQGSFLMGRYLRATIQFIALAIAIALFISMFFVESCYKGPLGAYSMILFITLVGWSMLDTNQLCKETGLDWEEESCYDLDIKNYPRAKNIWLLICCIAVAALVIPFSSSNGVIGFGIAITVIHCIVSVVCLIIDGILLKKRNTVVLHIQ